MKMRKLLAVVLAVTMAISAMALSVFAEDIEIDLYNYKSSSTYTANYSYTIPAYGNYGILNQGDYLLITLPTSLSAYTTSGSSTTAYYVLYNATTGVIEDTITAAEYATGNYNKYDVAGYEAVKSDAGTILYYALSGDSTTVNVVSGASVDNSNRSGSYTNCQNIVTLTDAMVEALTADDAEVTLTVTTADLTGTAYGGTDTTFTLCVEPASGTTNYWDHSYYAANDGSTTTITFDATELDTLTNVEVGGTLLLNMNSNNGDGDGDDGAALSVSIDVTYTPEVSGTGVVTVAEYNAATVYNTYAEKGYVASDITTSTSDTTLTPAYNFEISYTLTVNGVTVDLKNPSDLDVDLDNDGDLTDTGDWDASAHYGLYTQQVNISTFARDYSAGTNGNADVSTDTPGWGYEVYATIPQSTLVSESTNIVITATVTYDGKSSHLAQSWEFAAGWWPSWDADATAEFYFYDVDGTVHALGDTNYTSGAEYGYGTKVEYYESSTWAEGALVGAVYAANGMTTSGPSTNDPSTSQKNVVIITDVDTDGETSQPLAWDHTLLNRSTILTAVNTEGATAKVVVDLDGSVYGFAIYTLNTVSDIASSEVWTDDAYWYTSLGDSALNVEAASTYVLTGGTTSQLVFEDVPLSTLYDSTYGVFNSYMSITQMITAEGNSNYGYYYYTNSDDNTLEATRVYLVISMPDDDTDLTVDDPVEPGDTDTEDEGTEDLTVNEPADVEPETNPTTGIVLALVPMAVAAAAAVASKRR